MAETFLEYVGPRALTATGHNVQFTIEGTAERKDEVQQALVDMGRVQQLVGHELIGAEASIFLRLDQQSTTRMTFATMGVGDVAVDVNVHYERSDLGAIEAINRFPENLATIQGIAENLKAQLVREVAP